MRDRDDAKSSGNRRSSDEEFLTEDDDSGALASQPLETLREGYSWVRALEIRHPGWRLAEADGIPFCPPAKRLAEMRVCLVSCGGVYRKGQRPFSTSPGLVPAELRRMRFNDRGDWSVREIGRDVDAADLAVSHAHYDHTDADEDINCVFPLTRLIELELDGWVGECAAMHFSLMGYVPEVEPIVAAAAQKLIPALKRLGVEAAVVSGGCALSHQSAALVQREIESSGIATVSISTCPDITRRLQVPRAATLRFPLGNPFGAALDSAAQSRVLRDALSLLEKARTPGETIDLPYDWVKT